MEEEEIVLSIDTIFKYNDYTQFISTKQANRPLLYWKWYYEIPHTPLNAKVLNGLIYKTTWEKEEVLQA